MSEPAITAKCFVCGSGPEGLTQYRGRSVVSVCQFKPEMTCPKCKNTGCVFLHDDVLDGELWRVCGNCDYIEHIGG